jgi:hypothetical protein
MVTVASICHQQPTCNNSASLCVRGCASLWGQLVILLWQHTLSACMLLHCAQHSLTLQGPTTAIRMHSAHLLLPFDVQVWATPSSLPAKPWAPQSSHCSKQATAASIKAPSKAVSNRRGAPTPVPTYTAKATWPTLQCSTPHAQATCRLSLRTLALGYRPSPLPSLAGRDPTPTLSHNRRHTPCCLRHMALHMALILFPTRVVAAMAISHSRTTAVGMGMA